jgi:hypothetical protein
MMAPRKCLFLLTFFLPGLLLAQRDTASVRVRHGDACQATITLAQVRVMPQHTAVITGKDGEQRTYTGALLKEVMMQACPSVAAIEKRTMVATLVQVDASDGYRAVVAMTETDSSFRAQPVLLTWQCDGKPLSDHDGPFQLVVPEDRRHARNVRKVTSLEVITR